MTPYDEHKFNNRLLAVATTILFFVVGAFALQGCIGNQKLGSAYPEQEGSLHLVVSDIAIDVSTSRVFAKDFVRFTHVGGSESMYVGPVKYEMYRMGLERPEDEFWRNELYLDCENLGDTEFWIRALYADPHGPAAPVKATLTVVDAFGQCGWPQFSEGGSEHGEQDDG